MTRKEGVAPVRVDGFRWTSNVEDEKALEAALMWRDSRGGAEFWLSQEGEKYPCLAMQISGSVGHVMYFPNDGHPGFRCLGGEGLAKGGATTLVFLGCDPGDGVDVPNEFVVPFGKALLIAKDFFRNRKMSDTVAWFEL
jgi:hypothetical protein